MFYDSGINQRKSTMNTPSIKKLEQAFPTKGKEIKALLTGETKTRSYQSVKELIDNCYHLPSYQHRLMTALTEITETHGIEHVDHATNEDLSFEYLNTGEMYALTIIMFDSGRIIVSSVGDVVERGDYI